MAKQTIDKAARERRSRRFVDTEVQSALLRHLALSWAAVFVVVAIVLLGIESYRGDFSLSLGACLDAIWLHNRSLVVALSILAPMMVYDSIRISHRFVGPMVSLRRELRRLGEGQDVDPISFRQGDYWTDIADSFNQVVDRIERLEAAQLEEPAEPVTVAR